MPKSNRCSSTPKYPRVETIQEQELEGENKQVYGRKETGKAESNQKGHIKGGIARIGTNSALRASSLAIKRVMKGKIAHLGHQFGTSCLIPGNQKVRKWIVKCLRQIDGLQIRHFVPHPAIKWASPNLRPTDTPDRILNIP
ncbi:uncharacterized protein OCT59_029045 [Rhizophagus irregularis]|uniref:uncharacterized protein n=1 Tax=Rhizophagus irregularis TaxID=588596 RepID=UPI00331991BB|nr:hypothetical protein OCT59_029045 [Rhizophagus irregularis]